MHVLSRLTVVRRVTVIGALFLSVVLVSTLHLIVRQWKDYRDMQAELSGLPASAALLRLAELSARHRGMSAGLLGGELAFKDKLEAARLEVDTALANVLSTTASWHTPRITHLREAIRSQWNALRSELESQNISEAQSFERHSSLIERELELLEEVVSVSALTLDRDVAFHYLVVVALEYAPRVREHLALLRGHGTRMLTQARFAPGDQALLAFTSTEARRIFDRDTVQIKRAVSANPAVLRALAPHLERRVATFTQATSLVETEIIHAVRPRISALTYFTAMTHALDAQSAMADATFDVLSAEVHSRAVVCKRTVLLTIATGCLLLLVNSWLVWSIIRSIRRDLDAREQARRAAARSSAFLASMLEAAPDAVVVVDANGSIELVNSQVERAFGFARADLLQGPAQVLFSQPSLVESLCRSTITSTTVIAADCKRKDGELFPVELGLSPVEIGQTQHLIMVARDMTQRRTLERQLQHSQRMESIGQLTGGLAHDFNNLLGVIIGNLDLLERHVERDEKAKARVRTAQRAALRGADLTKRLLAFARRQPLNPQPTSINQLVGELLEMLPRTLGPEIKISAKLAAELPDATIDAAGLESALLNLALNARDAMPEGGRLSFATELVQLDHTHATVQTGEVKPGSYIRIAVSDTGLGMSQDTINKAFEPFFTTKARGKGTGLGLAMVYGFAKQSNGNVRIYSELGVGTTITLYVPQAQGALAAAPEPQLAPTQTNPGDLSATVLVVDDEVDLLEVAVSYCEELGLRVLHATDGPSALELARSEPQIDMLLTDVVMPGMHGIALAARLRTHYPQIRVVYCSGFPSSALAERSQLQVDGPLINKPYTKSIFIETVRATLATNRKDHAA